MIRSAYPSPGIQSMLAYEISLLDMMVRFRSKSSNTTRFTSVVKLCMAVAHRKLDLDISDCRAAVKTISCLDSANSGLGGRPYHMLASLELIGPIEDARNFKDHGLGLH